MASGFSIDEKKAIIVDSLLPMLRNDMHRVVDCTCREHGKPGSGPNFTAAMLCLIACEVVGRLSSDPTLNDHDATVEFLYRVADQTGEVRYCQCAEVLIAFFRHGIVHLFMPKQLSGVKARVEWAQVEGTEEGVCVDKLASPRGSVMLDTLRSRHLSLDQIDGQRVLIVVPQVLYVDVIKATDTFERAILTSDPKTLAYVDKGFEKWLKQATSIRRQLDIKARNYLGIP